jgi:hypothetical protein
MTMKLRRALIAITLTTMALGACAPQTRFVWGDYEDALYVYYKDPSQKALYRKALVAAIAEGRKENKVAPGLLAELGYIDLEDGNTAEAITCFNEEMTLFPESRPFLQGVVQRAQSGAPAAKPSGATS